MINLNGTGVALVTPFQKDLTIDFKAYAKLLNFVSEGVDYLVVQGTTGESPTTNTVEKNKLLSFTKANNSKNLPIVYGLGGNNTTVIIDTLSETDFSEVAAILSVSPYYNKPTQKSIIAHYTAIADASPVPVILYNVPGRTGTNMSSTTTLELAGHNNILGIKEASGDLGQALQIAVNMPKDFQLISGDDMLTVPMISLGATGVISVLANAFPVRFSKMVSKALSGDFKGCMDDLRYFDSINPLMYEEANPVGIKAALRILGICEDNCRPPLQSASTELSNKINVLI